MRTVLSLMFLFIMIQSCSNKSNVTERLLILADSNTVASIKRINITNDRIYHVLEEKMYDPHTSTKAAIWLPKVQQVHKFINNLISNIKIFQKKEAKNTNELVSDINIIKDSLLNIDPLINEYLKSEIKAFPNSFDSSDKQSIVFINSYLSKLSPNQFNLFFNQLKLQIMLLENSLIKFCEEQVPNNGDYFDTYSVIISQNSFVIPPRKELKVTAGVGAFSWKAQPVITINGKNIEIGDEGTANYKIIVPKKEGRYYVPVKIQFYDLEHKQQTIGKKVEYQVKN